MKTKKKWSREETKLIERKIKTLMPNQKLEIKKLNRKEKINKKGNKEMKMRKLNFLSVVEIFF